MIILAKGQKALISAAARFEYRYQTDASPILFSFSAEANIERYEFISFINQGDLISFPK